MNAVLLVFVAEAFEEVGVGQKIVRDLDEALARIRDYVQPYEDQRLREQAGIGTILARILILERDFRPGRTTIVLVRESVGV